MNGKDRIMALINGRPTDRVPCFSANSTVTYGQMEEVKAYWPEGHTKGETMARQALAAHTVIGFDAVRVPFCQTFEAVALGCRYKASKGIEGMEGIPGIEDPPPYNLDDTPVFPSDFLSKGNIPELIKAVRILKRELDDNAAVIGGIIGPFTLAADMLGTVPFLKATFKAPHKLRPFLEVAETAGTTLAKALIDAGADIISCEDMTASPELIAPHTYPELELEFQTRQFQSIPVPKILHICGNVDPIVESMAMTGATILSIEPKTDVKLAHEKCGPHIFLMGGVDTANTLLVQDPNQVKEICEASISEGIQILAPGCAVAPGTPTENLLAMVKAAKAS
ncbi:MAG: MtaA/CmuA family methyltransferase [Deltaproteobacteria bacterium]|nr:MtaA/CmuA family methyltransferase [Deltaproteobacteria bacterium]